jgi:MFS transporter, DHA2 family, methylenomycin A resistance protein
VLAAVTLAFAVVQLDVSVVNVAARAIGSGLGSGVTGVQWVVDAYTLTFAALILSAGSLGDRIGARRVLLGGFVLFVVASMACGAAPSIDFLVAARLVQGVGAAALGACSLALLNHTFTSPASRARAVGVWAMGGSAALAFGPVAGGVLITAAGWRSIFYINVPLGIVGWWLVARYGAETPRSAGRGVDLPGQAAAMAALSLLAGATIAGGTLGFGSEYVVGGYLAAAVAGVVFVLLERRAGPRAMVPLSLFRSRVFSVTAGIGFMINVVFYGLIFVFSLYLQRQDRLSPLAAGLAFLPVMVAIMASNVLSGRLVRRRGARWVIVAGALLMIMGCAGGVAWPPVLAIAGLSVTALSVTGFGIGLIVPAITAALLGSVDRSRSGIASGTLTAFRQTGSVLGVALFGSLLAGHDAVGGLRLACLIGAVLAVAVGVLSLGMRVASSPLPHMHQTPQETRTGRARPQLRRKFGACYSRAGPAVAGSRPA